MVTHLLFWIFGMASLVVFTLWGKNRLTDQLRIRTDLEASHRSLEKALEEVKTLRGILPICSCCKKIRDEEGFWNQVESYVRSHSEAEFTHSYCPECYEKQLEDIE